MIVCGKCGFTQPKDVYCANCGVNLEKYKPEKPPKLVQLLKDPYFQISFSIIVAIAAFFIFINKPSAPANDELSFTPEVEVTDSNVESPEGKVVELDDEQLKTMKSPKVKAKVPSFKKQLKALAKGGKDKPKKVAKAEVSTASLADSSDSDNDEVTPAAVTVKTATFNFYEILPGQVEKYFTGGAKVAASVLKKGELNIQNLSAARLPIDRNWELAKSKSSQLDYMVESLEDGELKGIKFVFSHSSKPNEPIDSIRIRVNANIPNKEGSASSIDWSRSLNISKEDVVLLKIQLPHNELSAAFLEDNYNSPLSIMGSPQFLEQKTQLLAVIRFE